MLRVRVRTSTRPPPFSTSTPCPYRTEADIPNHSPIRSATFIRCAVSVYDALDILLKFIIGDVHEVLRRAALCFAEAPTTWPMLVVKGHHRRWARDRSFASLRMTVPALVVKSHHPRGAPSRFFSSLSVTVPPLV